MKPYDLEHICMLLTAIGYPEQYLDTLAPMQIVNIWRKEFGYEG